MLLNKTISKLDWLGIVLSGTSALLSGVCAVHCLLMPLIMPALIVLNLNSVASEIEFWSWAITFGLCFIVTIFQFVFKHRHASVFVPLTVGFVLIWKKELLSAQVQPYVPLAVGLLLVATHILNMQLCKLCPKCKTQK